MSDNSVWNEIEMILSRKLVPDGPAPLTKPHEAGVSQPESGKDITMDLPTGEVVFRVEGILFRV